MRKPIQALLLFVLLVLCGGRIASADDRGDARAHYQSGVKLYNGGDYRGAIKEFAAAQQLMPADLNSYNLALCYDKLGEAEPAIQYYKEYLAKVPSTDKRAEIEASVSRLDGALKSATQKKTDEDAARKADDQRKADATAAAQKKAQEDAARKAQEDADARRVEDSRRAPTPTLTPAPDGGNVGAPPPTSVGSTGTPSTGAPQPTGDAQLDRVQQIDINSIRDQRGFGGTTGGAPAPTVAGAQPATQNLNTMAPNPGMNPNAPVGAQPNTASAAPPNGAQPGGMAPPNGAPMDTTKPATEEPVYKKWWFWAVVAVSAYVVYEIANDNSSNNVNRSSHEMPLNGKGNATPMGNGGFTLIRW